MMFYTVAVGDSYGNLRVTSTTYHKNGDCPALSDSDSITICGGMKEGFEPCGLCYDRGESDE